MPSALFDRLSADLVDHEELLAVLSYHFTMAQGDPIGGIAFPDTPNARLLVRVKGDLISDIEAGPCFDEEEAAALEAEVRRKLVEGQTRTILTGIALSDLPVTGYFRAPGDAFQLLPAPPQAPRPPALLGRHPFLIEYPVMTGPDLLINGQRGAIALARWVSFLNATLLGHFSTIPTNAHQTWVVVLDAADDPVPKPQWSQESYYIPDLKVTEGDFSSPGAPPVSMRDQDDYYGRPGYSVGQSVDLPTTFPDDIGRFMALDDLRRARFLRAAQWRTAADDLWGRHKASWYIAEVAAIETLANETVPARPCPECLKDMNPGPTARFKDFLDRYAPGSGTRRGNADLYAIRSGLVHGGTLLHHDSPFGSGLLAFATNEREPMDRLSRAVSIAMVNWLRAQAVGI